MNENDPAPGAIRTVRTHVYYDPDNGGVIHVHRIATPTDQELDEERLADEVAIFEESLIQRHGRSLARIEADESALQAAMAPGVTLRVDVEQRRLVPHQ